MNVNEKPQFTTLLRSALAMYPNTRMDADVVSLWWSCLVPYDFGQVKTAMQTHITNRDAGRFAPKPADLLGHLQRNDGWIEPEEAWAMVKRSLSDESISLVWTPPMQVAFGVALGAGDDMVQARLAFVERYELELFAARQRGEKPYWQLSPGTNAAARDDAIRDAARLGRLPQEYATRMISNQGIPVSDDIASLIKK